MTESIEASRSSEKEEIIENTRWELDTLNSDIISLDIKKESFGAKQELKDRIKTLWFYDWDENWETIKFNIVNIRKYLESIKNNKY